MQRALVSLAAATWEVRGAQLMLAASSDTSWSATRYEVVRAAAGEARGEGARCASERGWDGNLPGSVTAAEAAARASIGAVEARSLEGARRFDFGDASYELLERPYVVVGDRLWDSSLVLSLYLRARPPPALARGAAAVVLELGAGLGLPSIDVGLRFPLARVVATDALRDVVDLLRTNVGRVCPGRVRAACLDYAEPPPPPPSPDVVLGSDICYLDAHVASLAAYLTAVRPPLTIIAAPTTRSHVYELAATLLATGADVREERFDLLSSSADAAPDPAAWHAAHFRILTIRYGE